MSPTKFANGVNHRLLLPPERTARAATFACALKAHDQNLPSSYNEEPETAEAKAADLVLSLMHWCRVEHVRFEQVLHRAEIVFKEASDAMR